MRVDQRKPLLTRKCCYKMMCFCMTASEVSNRFITELCFMDQCGAPFKLADDLLVNIQHVKSQ